MRLRTGWALSLFVSLGVGSWVHEPWTFFSPDISLSPADQKWLYEQLSRFRSFSEPERSLMGESVLEDMLRRDPELEMDDLWIKVLDDVHGLSASYRLRVYDRLATYAGTESARRRAVLGLIEAEAWALLAEVAVRDNSGSLRVLASEAVAHSGDSLHGPAQDFMIEASFDRVPEVRLWACRALGLCPAGRTVDIALARASQDSDPKVRWAAWGARLIRFAAGKSSLEPSSLPESLKKGGALRSEPGVEAILENPAIRALGIHAPGS